VTGLYPVTQDSNAEIETDFVDYQVFKNDSILQSSEAGHKKRAKVEKFVQIIVTLKLKVNERLHLRRFHLHDQNNYQHDQYRFPQHRKACNCFPGFVFHSFGQYVQGKTQSHPKHDRCVAVEKIGKNTGPEIEGDLMQHRPGSFHIFRPEKNPAKTNEMKSP
jgi:hypothetical protein